MNQAGHTMPIGVLSNQLAALWNELCLARREIERLRRERDALLAERARSSHLAAPADAGPQNNSQAGPEVKEV
jgi:hypothetical protein